ncbi:hypothetical protein C2845_PM10G17390 [Panicum miliaceum]|uniref:Response regulatory domain-containing protein n=1 Tax=Panicum miliaceum TaxID=4540 RepID=A0A3L6PDP7_PANMI|nr:hypothetical protein C2845_PM10G17390 [Panicum miliaceum]
MEAEVLGRKPLQQEEMDVNQFPAGLRVLAVDDDLTTVTEAKTALDMLRERKGRDDQFDVVISDVFMPGIDGFKLPELISLEMVIMLSANDEMETMMKGIKHGACDYLVKPARMEQVRNIWTHVVKKNRSDPRNNTSDEAVPKKILELMNVDGLTGDNVASHLQKYRIYLRKLSEGTLSHSNPFMDEPQAPESSQHHAQLVQPSPSSVGASNSSNARMSYPSTFGMHNLQQDLVLVGNGVNLPKDVPVPVPVPVPVQDLGRFIYSGRPYATGSSGSLSSSSQCFPSGPSSSSSTNISNGVVFSTSKPFSSGTSGSSSASISNDYSPSATSMRFPSSRSCSFYASILRGEMLQANRGIPFDANSFFEEIANGDMPASSSHLPLQHAELADQPLVHIQPSSAGQFNQVAPSSHLPLHSPELVNQPLIQIQTSSVGLSNYQVDRESHQFSGLYNPINSSRVSVPTRFPDIGYSAGMPISSSHGNHVRINQLSRSVASSGYIPTFGSQHQNQMSGLLGRTTPTLGFSEQAAPFNFGSSVMPIGSSALGSSSSVGPALADLQIGNSVTPTQMLSGGAATGSLPGGGPVDQQAVGDQLNNSNVLPARTSEVQDGVIDDVSHFFADWVNQSDFLSNDDAAFHGNM